MKNFVLAIVIFFCSIASVFSQKKVDKYCEIMTYEKGFGQKLRIILSLGEVDSLFSFTDPSIKTTLQKVTSLKTVPDVLNYMSLLGWKLVNSTAISVSGTKNFYFKKEFEDSDLLTIKK